LRKRNNADKKEEEVGGVASKDINEAQGKTAKEADRKSPRACIKRDMRVSGFLRSVRANCI